MTWRPGPVTHDGAPGVEIDVNETFRELKLRIRRLEEVLAHGGLGNMEFAQAVSRVRRSVRHGDRSREPSVELRGLLERAEALAPGGV